MPDATADQWVLLLPVYQDWEAAGLLREQIDRVLGGAGERAREPSPAANRPYWKGGPKAPLSVCLE